MTSVASTRQPLLRVEGLKKHFESARLSGAHGRPIKAVDGVSLTIEAGQTLGLVGESGSGKSTVGRLIVRLLKPTAGRIFIEGVETTDLSRSALRPFRRQMQIVMQDPYASLNPRMKTGDIVGVPLRNYREFSRAERRKRVLDLLERVGLSPDHAGRFPHEFSGGQRQRIGIARALALEPRLVVLDEPVSALDVSVQAQIVNLLKDLQEDLGLAYLLIAHDLSIIKHACDEVAVMYLGRIVESGSRHDLYDNPTHPYSQALLSAVPVANPSLRGTRNRIVLQGDPPSPSAVIDGCNFRSRCFRPQAECQNEDPQLADRAGHGHPSACLFPKALDETARDSA
jgi:peptide/nickel transport system ATP-binding protein/oligopeptide transport system ATP-binding protein